MSDLKLLQLLEFINSRLTNIEKNIVKLDEKLEHAIMLQRNHLIRIKNGENLDDSTILLGCPYNDLSPEKAKMLYGDQNKDFLILDVSDKDFEAPVKLEASFKIPLEELDRRYVEITNKTTPIMIISEDGLKSISACEILVRKGFFNLNNISGGYRFWPAELKDDASKLQIAR